MGDWAARLTRVVRGWMAGPSLLPALAVVLVVVGVGAVALMSAAFSDGYGDTSQAVGEQRHADAGQVGGAGRAEDDAQTAGPPTGVSSGPPAGVNRLPRAKVGQEVDFGDGLLAKVADVKAIDVKAVGPGETSGSGIAVRLVIRNTSKAPVDLAQLSVDVTDLERVPAVPSRGKPADWLRGHLKRDAAATGTYVFRYEGALDRLSIDIYNAGSPNIVVVRP